MMKKLFAVLIAIVAFVTFSSFVVSNLYVNDVEFEEKGNDYVFFTNVTGWSSATDSDTYPIYYKEGNGERMYYFGSYHYSIYDNEFFNSPVCDDFRKNYRYVSGEIYFNCSLPGRVEEIVDGYRFHTQVKGWCNATDSDIYSIYYKEGNGERVYYFGSYHYSIHDNEYFNSPVCDDFRKNYRYVSGEIYFNCSLSGRVEEIVDGYRFYTQVKGWCNATDSDIYSIYYKEGNGEREYYFGCYHYSIHDNEKYNSPNCNDFRKKYKYVSDGRYFNCNLPGRR